MKSGISQQPLIKSFSNFKPELREQTQNGKVQESKTTFNRRLSQNTKVEYLSNHRSDHTQIINLN